MRKKLASAVAADSDEGAPRRGFDLRPKPAQYPVGQPCLTGEQPPGPAVDSIRAFQLSTAGVELVLPARDRRIRSAAGGGGDDAAQAGRLSSSRVGLASRAIASDI